MVVYLYLQTYRNVQFVKVEVRVDLEIVSSICVWIIQEIWLKDNVPLKDVLDLLPYQNVLNVQEMINAVQGCVDKLEELKDVYYHNLYKGQFLDVAGIDA